MSETTQFTDFTNMPPSVTELPEELRQSAYGNAGRLQAVGERAGKLNDFERLVFCRTAQGQTLDQISKSASPPIRLATLSEKREKVLRMFQISRSEIPYAALLHELIEPNPTSIVRPELSDTHGLHFYLGAIGVSYTEVADTLGLTGRQVKAFRREASQEFGSTTIGRVIHAAFACGYFQSAQAQKRTA